MSDSENHGAADGVHHQSHPRLWRANTSHWLQAKAKIMVVRDIERDDIDYISRTLGCQPVSHPDHLNSSKLGTADLVEDAAVGAGRMVCLPACT